MDRWYIEQGPLPDTSPQLSGTLTVYLWGFLLMFALALALGGWALNKARRNPDDLWTYFVAAVLWPLFVCAVLFVFLWSLLSRNNHRH